jgi:hypothetical protein
MTPGGSSQRLDKPRGLGYISILRVVCLLFVALKGKVEIDTIVLEMNEGSCSLIVWKVQFWFEVQNTLSLVGS